MKKKSHQRITKIKLDQILELLKRAEHTSVEDACVIQPATDQLTPYPDMDNLRLWTRDYLTKGLNKILINKLGADGQTYMTTLIDGLPLFTKMSKTIGENLETSKPGLWLSNLIQPVSASQAGSWLRSNLIHSDEDKYSLINNYVVGNYSNTFTQPALIMHPLNTTQQGYLCPIDSHATGGDDMMYYNQHYSPAISSCINYINQPDNNSYYSLPPYKFEYKYGSYQTIAFPKDPDMQTYTESNSSCLNYNFTNPSDDGTACNLTLYNLQAANSSQKPEFISKITFTPNGKGSGNNYGSDDNPEAINGSNGGCVSGKLTWTTTINGVETECSKEFNECFMTSQALKWNANVPNKENETDINNQSYKSIFGLFDGSRVYNRTAGEDVDHMTTGQYRINFNNNGSKTTSSCKKVAPEYQSECNSKCNGSCTYTPTTTSGTYNVEASYGKDGPASISDDDNSFATDTRWSYLIPGAISFQLEQTGLGYSPNYSLYGCSCGWTGDLKGYVSFSFATPEEITAQSNVTLYLNITDSKKQYNEMGIPWEYGCDVSPYHLSVSTTNESLNNPNITSRVIAENVNINDLGDIDYLTTKYL